jgi:hypothetical protein
MPETLIHEEIKYPVPAGIEELPPPRLGDLLTFYTYRQASPWLHMAPATVRRHVASGLIPRRFITKYPGPRGRVFFTGDQIMRLLAYFAEADWNTTLPQGRAHVARRRTARRVA